MVIKRRSKIGLIFTMLLSGVLVAWPVSADHLGDYWATAAVTAIPAFSQTGDVASVTFMNPSHGWGVRQKSISQDARLFIPVTAPLGSVFDTIGLRAEDNVRGQNANLGYVQATLYRQPLGAEPQSAGPAQIVGFVRTNNVSSPADGFQQIASPLLHPVTLSPGYSYYIEVFFKNPGLVVFLPGTSTNVTVYNVWLQGSLNRDACFDLRDNDRDGDVDCADTDCLRDFGTSCF